MAAAKARATVPANGVDLVDENDRWGVRLGLLEQVAHPAGAHANEHLHELGSGDGVERHVGLPGDRPGDQGLARPRRPVQENALWDLGPHRPELLRLLEELLDLFELLDSLIDAGDVIEGDRLQILGDLLRLRLAKLHHLVATALELVEEEDEEPDQQQIREDVADEPLDQRRVLVDDIDVDVGCKDACGQPGFGLPRISQDKHRLPRLLGRAVGCALPGDLVGLLLHLDGSFDLTRLELLVELRQAELDRRAALVEECRHGHDDEEDHREVDENGACGSAQDAPGLMWAASWYAVIAANPAPTATVGHVILRRP